MTCERRRTPDFLILGAQKAGTTSLFRYLASHPSVFVPRVKETHFFAYQGKEVPDRNSADVEFINTLEDYLDLFAEAPDDMVTGEASPSYLYLEEVPRRIHDLVPDAKLIALLRDPVERAFSNYLHCVRTGREDLSFEDAIRAEDERIADGWPHVYHYRQKGFYSEQIKRYLAVFREDQFQVWLTDDLARDPEGLLAETCRLLGIRPTWNADLSRRHNTSVVPRNDAVRWMLEQIRGGTTDWTRAVPSGIRDLAKEWLFESSTIEEATAERLRDAYRHDIVELEGLLERDLSRWK